MPTGLFVSDTLGLSYAEAKEVCARCPVIVECRSFAVQVGINVGLWGGLSPKERKEWAKARAQATTARSYSTPRSW